MPSKAWEFYAGILIPPGLIVPFNDVVGNIQPGWISFGSADGKAIKGATSLAGLTGGSSSVSLSVTGSGGAHVGGATRLFRTGDSPTDPSAWNYKDLSTKMVHDHTLTLSYRPARRRLILMKSTKSHSSFPANTALMSVAVRGDLTDITPTGKILAEDAVLAGDDVVINNSTTDATGDHSHWLSGYTSYKADATAQAKIASGSHDHQGPLDVTDNIRRFYVGLYTDAAKNFNADRNTIAMWESATPPVGWKICDGTDGTPDLSDYFIGFDVSKINSKEGNGTLAINGGTLASDTGHNHNNGSNNQHPAFCGHNTVVHDHSYSAENKNFEPEYYTLIFVMPK